MEKSNCGEIVNILQLFNFYTGAEQQLDSTPISCNEESSALPDCATAVGHEYLNLFWSKISGKAKFPTFIMISKPNCTKIVNIKIFYTDAKQQLDSTPISYDEELSALPDCATAVGHEYLNLFWSKISGKVKFPTFIMIS
jgi:hypothetical protein